MATKYDNVIIFGPTGGVGAAAALEASKRGAKVWLAMRDPSKPIDDIPADVEKAGNFARVRADLADPASVGKAIEESGAKAAYVYVILALSDHMRGAFRALKDAGVENIVLLSTATIQGGVDIRSIPKEDIIPYRHAQAEIAVEELGFPYFTALRPFNFASNHFKQYLDRSAKPPRAEILYLDSWMDNIVPEDIGAVGAAVLVNRSSGGKEIIYLFGPEVKTVEEIWAIIKRVTGRDDIDTTPLSKEESLAKLLKKGVPPPIAHYLVEQLGLWRDAERIYPESVHVPAVANIKKYTGREPTKFEDYIAAHKAEWQAI